MENQYRTHYIKEITNQLIGKKIKVAGFIENIRDHGGVIFLDLRDGTDVLQLVSNDENLFAGLTRESAVHALGTIRQREEEDYNTKIKTGTIELLVSSLTVDGQAKHVLPFEIPLSMHSSEDIRLKYRYLDLRNPKVHSHILFRSQVISFLRKKMESLGFSEITTPILTASSPEGAREFIVPARKFHGKFYVLPQAPQLFKQLLMVGGFDKYFQIAPCFRDEDARSDRLYGEFYQLDFEAAFVTEEDIYQIGEDIFYDTFTKFSNKKVSSKPFVRISYEEAMEKYGTDKPDLRNPLEIIDLTNQFQNTTFKPFQNIPVRAIKVENIADKSNSWFNELVDYAKTLGMPGIGYIKVNEDMSFNGPIDKFLTDEERKQLIQTASLESGSVLFFIADKKRSRELAGEIRMELGRKLDLMDPNEYKFAIINDFPMYEYNEEEDRYDFSHNPFSMPQGGLKALEEQDLKDIKAYQYDFVCNGIEMSSGAIRNHDVEIMKKAFELAGYDIATVKDKFGALYTAFQYGCPPHGGMAPGIDRMIMMLLEENNIRETVAFPMTSSGQDLMMSSPNDVTELQLRETHIKIR